MKQANKFMIWKLKQNDKETNILWMSEGKKDSSSSAVTQEQSKNRKKTQISDILKFDYTPNKVGKIVPP